MHALTLTLSRLWNEQEGQDLTEYALLLVLLALFMIAGVNKVATALNTVFTNAASTLTGDVPGAN